MGDLIIHGIKVAFWIGIALVFMTAIQALLNLLTTIVFSNVVGEIFGAISCFLPFDGGAVFSAIGTAISAILAFLVAKKIYEYSSHNNPLTS